MYSMLPEFEYSIKIVIGINVHTKIKVTSRLFQPKRKFKYFLEFALKDLLVRVKCLHFPGSIANVLTTISTKFLLSFSASMALVKIDLYF